jgi:murein DD-endopeptidase MepM/ murein hydrolase activator NlpD
MRKILVFLFIPFFLLAYKIDIHKWSRNDTFYTFLKKNSLPLSIYYDLPPNIKRYVRSIPIGESVFILRKNNIIKQALIPINSKEQLQIIKKENKYITKIVPIIYETVKKHANAKIKHYLSYDLYKATKLRSLTLKLVDIFSDRINFRALPKNTNIDIIYEEKLKFGEVKDVKILYAKVSNRYYTINAFLNPQDGRYYDSNGKSLKGMFLAAPLRYKRISSRFGMRFHPIFHKWKMHYGIDYVNRIGTPIHSVADGRIIFKGWLKGYGRAVKIKHKNGYITLYAHLYGWPRGIYVGKWVKQGQTIGYLGNSGLSTGPHLHFGVMYYGKWINPIRIRHSVKTKLYGKKRKEFLAYIKKFTKENNIVLK